ncbi:hypothetical protein INS49_003895 [Diaporthe citri]|uniref:uncharacterized protein n=1 Tax=Diaporthe citri TaxID=83186 RepID=UPI001C7F9C65|nr:uncharacterized protein INS49_003895 [Diaporthe citri]KAG6354814.1 hypothetical protein INS49_003895 [Diaporthe citri]
MPPQTRVRSRSSVEHIFDLVEGLDEDQLHNLLDELNSTTDTNVPVSKGVEYFEEQRRARAAQKVLRPTPSFLNSPHEPVDWPRQKPRPVSGSQWRQSMRVVSTPYGHLGRHQTEPISPPLTASPPSSPPLSPPSHGSPLSPRRTVTTPILPMEKSARQGGEIESLPLQKRPASPPRQHDDEEHDGTEREHESRPSLHEFGGFTFGFDGAAQSADAETPQQQQPNKEVRPVSPLSPSQQQEQDAPAPAPQRADFSRISTMPLPSLAATDSVFDLPRPRTSTGDAATTANTFKPRAFRRISRPQFLSPANIPTPDALAERLSQYFFDGPSSPPPPAGFSSLAAPPPSRPSAEMSMEQMLKEPAAPPSKLVLGRVEKEVPSVGIFEVLTEG